jgi:hypothetical protein
MKMFISHNNLSNHWISHRLGQTEQQQQQQPQQQQQQQQQQQSVFTAQI